MVTVLIPRNITELKECEAVFFDFDGVIADTMDDNYSAWYYALKKYSMTITRDEYFLMEGRTTYEVIDYISSSKSIKIDPVARDNIVRDKEKYYLERNNFNLYKGVDRLLITLKNKGILLGLVSGASIQRIKKTCTGSVLNLFDIIVTADDVKKGKPDPEPYLRASEKLNVRSNKCVVVENAPLGIDSAVKAGMFCIAVTTTLSKPYLGKASLILERPADIIPLFNKLDGNNI